MVEELIFTSAVRGLQVGKSGFCTVATTPEMASNLILMLESLSGYRHLFPPGTAEAAKNPVAYSFLKVKVGVHQRYVLSRVADVGVDYSNRSNKLAHHLALPCQPPPPGGPSRILLQKDFFAKTWQEDPRVLEPRTVPNRVSKPAACKYWQKVTGDAGWAGEVLEAALSQQMVYLIVKPSTPTIGLLHEAVSLLPPERQWQVTFSSFFRRLPPKAECQIRCVIEGSPEIQMARQSQSTSLLLDLTKPLGRCSSAWADFARQGTLITEMPKRHLPTGMPVLTSSAPLEQLPPALPSSEPEPGSSSFTPALPKNLPPTLPTDHDELDESDLVESKKRRFPVLWVLVGLCLAGILSLALLPDLRNQLFSLRWLPKIGGEELDLPPAPRPYAAKPKQEGQNAEGGPAGVAANGAAGQSQAGSPDSQPHTGNAPNTNANLRTNPQRVGQQALVSINQGSRSSAGNLQPSNLSPTKGVGAAAITGPTGAVKSNSNQRSSGGLAPTRRVYGDHRNPNPPGVASSRKQDPDVTTNDDAPDSTVTEPVETLIVLDSAQQVAFADRWQGIEKKSTPIQVVAVNHPAQPGRSVTLNLLDPSGRLTLEPRDSVSWLLSAAGKEMGTWALVSRDFGSEIEFQSAVNRSGRSVLLADDIDAINAATLEIGFAGGIVVEFDFTLQFVAGHISFDKGARYNDVMFDLENDVLKQQLANVSIQLQLQQGAAGQATATGVGDAAGETVTVDFPISFDGLDTLATFSEQELQLLDSIRPRVQLEITKSSGKSLRYRWTGFSGEFGGGGRSDVKAWRFTSHPFDVLERGLRARRKYLRAVQCGREQPQPGDDTESIDQQLLAIDASAQTLNRASKKTSRSSNIKSLMPQQLPSPVQMKTDGGQSYLLYLDLGDEGVMWSAEAMRGAYHGVGRSSPIQ